MSGRKFAIVLGAVLWLSVSAAPAARADDGLLGDATQVVGDAVEVVDPIEQTVQSTTPQPVLQPEEPVVPPTLAPVTNEVVDHVATVEQEAGRAVEATVRLAEQAGQPVVRIAETTGRPADEPPAEAVDPAVPSPPTPAGTETAVLPGTPSGPADDVPAGEGAQPVSEAAPGPGGAQRSAQRRFAIAPIRSAMAAPRHILRVEDDPPSDQELWTLTNQLMHMWAGDRPPNGVDAGLVGENPGPRASVAFDIVPLLYGLVLGVVAMVLARRGRQAGTVVTARPSR